MGEHTRTIFGIHHVQIEAPEGCENLARRFYGEILGLTEIPKPESLRKRGGVWFACGAQQIHIGVMHDFTPRWKGHPALEVNDLRAWRDHLLAMNIHIADENPLSGWKRCCIADPWGNRIELLERNAVPPSSE